MSTDKKKHWRIVHYINQFHAGIGGEDKALSGLSWKAEPMGPGKLLQRTFHREASIVATLFCGDDYFVDNQEEVLIRAIEFIAEQKPDLLIAGPAFNAGRYGQACGALCRSTQRELTIPAVTGMYQENPAVEIYHKDVYIIETPSRASKMPALLDKMFHLGIRLAKGETIGSASDEGYFSRGIRKNVSGEKTGAERAVGMLLDKLEGRVFTTEVQGPKYETITSPKGINDLSKAIIAIVTDGGIVPLGNPDRIKGCAADNPVGKYSVRDIDDLKQEDFECIARGIDHRVASADPDRFVPLDVMRELESEGKIGHLYPWIYSTSGCTMDFDNAIRIGREVAKDLVKDSVTGVILTSA